MITGNLSAPNKTDSVVFASDTVGGYPELSYFKVSKLIPAIKDNPSLFLRFTNI